VDPERFAEAAAALRALGDLPDRQRMVLVMHCQQQIADELGLSRGAVAASIFKARRKLEKSLGLKDTELYTVDGRGAGLTPAALGRDPIATRLLGWFRG
jgi:RNA polymerase sigma-70 factor (ECF subfamily)